MFQQGAKRRAMSPSGLVCCAGPCVFRLAANGTCAAKVRSADQRAIEILTAVRLRALASKRTFCAPFPIATTTSRQRLPCTSSAYVRAFPCLAACKLGSCFVVYVRGVVKPSWCPLPIVHHCTMARHRQ